MAERPLYTLYKNLKAQNYDVPDDYNKFESALTRDGKGGADNRHAIYENLKAQNFDVPSTYERFYSALFEPRSKTSSRAKGGSVPMSAADRARFSAGAAAISASAQQTMNNAGRYNRLKQRKQKQQKDFGRVNLGTHQTPYGGDANNVVKDDFAYNPETGKIGAYVTSDNENVYSLPEAEQMQAILDKQNDAYQVAVDTGEIPSAFDVRDKNGNYDLQENIGKNGTYLTEEGAQKQFDKKLADAYARKKEIEALIAEDNRQHGNPLLSYGASIGASNGRTAEQSDYRNKLATSLSLVTEQIGALEAVKQYPTSSWGEDALKALDNTAFTAKTWDFGLTDFAIMGQMERIKTKMDNNIPLSGSDKMLLKSKLGADAATALEDEKMGNVYRWTKIAGQSLPFMADFFLTGGYGGITKGISRGALKFAAKRGMGKVGAAILKNTGIVAGDVIGSYAMAGTEQALKTGADIMQRHLGNLYQDEKGDYKFGTFDENGNLLHEGGESIGTALYKGMTSAMVENYTEKLFGHNYGIKKGAVNFMEKHGMNASAEFFKNIGKSGWYTNSKKWMEKFGINGFAEEVMEEEIGIPLHALLDGEGKVSDLLDAKQQLDIIGGMAISVGSMYAMGAGSRPVKGIYNRAQYYRFRNKVNVADIDAQNLMGDNWAGIKDKIDNATNEQMGGVLADILRQRDTMTKEQINAAVNYGINLMKMRGYNIAKTAEMNAKEITNEPTTPEEQHQADIDNAYSEGHDADDADKHDIQIQQEDQMKTLAAALGISEQQLSAMSDEELESLTGQDDKLDQAIYDYQLSSARYQGVVDDAQDKADLAAHQAEQRVDMYTDQSRGSVRNATIKASGGLEEYGVYIISGNIATHDDGSIDVSNSDDMILYYDPTTNSVEHADALMFAELGEELPADEVKVQAVADAKENAIKEVAGIIDGTVEVGSQFNVTDTDGTEHTYEVLADYGDGTAAISIDGNVVENPYSLADLQKMKDLEDQKRLETAKAEREQMEKERAAQQTQNTEETQPSFDFNQILNDNGNVVLVDVLGKDGNTKYPDSRLFLIRDTGAKAKVVELKSDGTIVPHAVNKEDVATISSMSLDEYKQAMPEFSMIEDNSGEIEVETPTIDGETAAPTEETAAPESAETPETEQTPTAPAITLEDGTIVPMLEDGNPDFSKLTAAQTAELYDNQFGEDADSIVSGYVSDAKKALDKASNMTVKGKTFVEQKAAKDAKEKAIADAQAAYDSAIAIRDAYNERQLAKVEDTAEGRKELIEKARRKFARLKSAVKDDAEAVSQLYRETIGSLLHRLYDSTGIDVTDTTPLTAEEYVASNLGAHSLNYEGTETSKGVKQETGLSREDFAKTQLLAADGKVTTIDALVHSLWENRPSNLESLDTQDIRNALIGVLNSGFKASEARNFVKNIRIAQAENILEEQKRAQENAAYAEQHKAEPEAELKAKSDEKAELKAKSEAKLDNESSNESNDLDNDLDNEKTNDNINDNINVPEDATDEAPLGAQRDESDLPFSAKENGKQQTTAERAADVEKNKVDDMKVVDNIVGEKTRKAFERLSKMMGATIQWQYSDKLGNGWIQETTDADGNVHRTIFITLDSSITEGAQFIFGHEMTHQIKNLNPAAYNELTQLVLDTYGSDAFDKAVDETMQRYSDAGFSGRAREYYAEEVVADSVGEMIRDLNLAHTLAMKMSHPLLAAIHEILQKIKLAFFGTEYSDVTKNIIRSIEQAYVKTANGEVTNSETGEDVSFSLRQKPEPKKKGVGYKVFVLKDGKLYPPMVANPDGAATPVGVWLDADAAPIAGESKTGRPQVKQGGKGTQGGSGKLAYRPGWHLGVVPYAIQFNRKDAEGNKTLFPKNFVFAEVEYAADVDYQEEARQEGINPSGKYQHSLAGLKHLPTDGYYMYRTNPNPETDPWVITGAMKVNRILTRAEQADLVSKAGREPQQIQEGDIVTDDVVNSINQEIADAPKFSLKVYHGSGADFTEFDFDHMGEGAGSQVFGWGGYVTSSKKIGKSYATLMDNDPSKAYYRIQRSNGTRFAKKYPTLESFLHGDKQIAKNDKFTEQEKIDYYNEMKKLAEPYHNLYEVDIPEDNGSNYLDWDKPLSKKQQDSIREGLEHLGVGIKTLESKGQSLERTGENIYNSTLYIGLTGTEYDLPERTKGISKFLSFVGFTGIKYKAGRNFGGAKKGDTNYVIFKPEDMKITQHTKFSLKSKPVRFETGKKLSDEKKKDAKAIKMATGWERGADANDIQRTLENLKDREKGTEYEQNLKDRLAEYKDALKWIDSIDEDYLTQGNANRYDVDIPDDNGNYLGWNDSQNFPLEKWYRLWEITHHGFNENEYFKDGGARYDKDRIERIIQMKLDSPENGMQRLPTLKGEELYHALEDFFDRERPSHGAELASRALSEIGFVGIKYPAGLIHGGAEEGDYNYVIFDENNANIVGNTRFSLRYDQFEHDLNQWKKDNNLPKDAQRPTIPQRNAGESAVDFLRRVDEYRKQMALWKTAPTYEQHLLSDDTALGEFNRELQRGSVLKRIAFQDSMLAIRKAQEAIMKEVGVDRLNMAEDAYTAENRSHGKGKNEFEEYNNEFLQPLRKAYHQMKKILGDSYDNVRIYMMAKHGLERDSQMAFKKSLEADYEDVAQRSAAYKAYKGDMNRIINDSDLEFGRVDFTTWRQRDNALRVKYSPSYMDYRYDENGIAYDYSGLSAIFDGSDFEETAYKLVKDIESKYVTETHNLWDATNAATKKILRDGYKAGMMSKDTYQYVRDMYSHYIPLRGWDGTTADQVWDYIGGGKGAFNQTLKKAHGRTSIADDPIAYIENMAESGILLNNKNWVKQHLMLLAQNHPTSLLTLSKAWYVKSTDANGNEEWIPATPQISSQMNSNQVKAAIDAFEKKMEQMAQAGDATQKRDGLNIAYPQTHSEEREHEVRVMKDGEEYVIYVNGDPQLAQAMNNTRAHRVSEGIKNSISKRVIAVVGRKMAAAYTSLSPLFIPSNYFRDLTMTLASTAIREDAKYNYLLRKNLATSWNLGFMLRDFQNGKLRDKVNNGNATPKEQMFYDFMMNGGETGFVSSLDVEDLKKKFKNDLKDLDRWKANPVKVGHTIMDSIEFLNRMIEDSNRFAVYMTSIQYGRSIDEAVNDAKDVTLNFNRKGTGEHSWQTIRNLYLFINPAVQSLQTLGALAKHHPFKFTAVTASWLASGVLVPIVNVALMQLGAAFLGGDGDDDKDWYKDISKKYWQFSKWDRRNNFIMWVPTTHEFVKIPLAQEFRAFYGLGDMIASKMMGGELAEESWEDYGWDLVGQVVDMLPLDPTGYDGNIAVSLMPNAIRPVFELAFNVDFTGKPLFKDTEYNKYDPNFTKAYVGTPDWLVRASRMMNSIGNDYPNVQQNKWDALGNPRYNLNNPAVVDHVLSSYLGGAYTMGSQVLGLLTKSLNDRKEIKVADIPLFSKFVSNPDDRPVTKKQGDEFWNMKENHDRAANTLSKLKKQAKVDGDYSMLERFYGSEEYKKYKQDDVKVKKYEEDKKKERAEESGEEYRPHKLNAEDIYKAHATPKDDFEDLKLKQLYTKLNGFKTSYDLLVDTAPSQSDGYYNNNKAAIDAIDEISLDKQEISELKKGFLDDGKDAYNAEDMKQIRDLRKKILSVLEKANKVVVANQKAKAKK